jgi:hypothetical protein
MAHDDLDRWNAKIMLQAVRELEKTFRVLQPSKAGAKSRSSDRHARR